jgi:hypothetical protein
VGEGSEISPSPARRGWGEGKTWLASSHLTQKRDAINPIKLAAHTARSLASAHATMESGLLRFVAGSQVVCAAA